MNVKLLRKVKKWILAEPKRLLMRTWIIEKQASYARKIYYETLSGKERYRPFPPCGTAACIAGWACILSNEKEYASRNYFCEVGANVLDLSSVQANKLFSPSLWPEQFRSGLADDGTRRAAEVAAKRIEHFIKTKGKE